jgi:hypothetical protein
MALHRADRAFVVCIGGTYKHSKTGNIYEVLDVSTHTETGERLVIYKNIHKEEYEIWARPKDMFEEYVEIDGKRVPRFEPLSTK